MNHHLGLPQQRLENSHTTPPQRVSAVPSRLQQLQQTYGNQALMQMLRARVPQPETQSSDVIQGAFEYTNSFHLARTDGNVTKLTANDLRVGDLKLPKAARPPTQFGNKQMAHSISWTLLKQSYERVSDMFLPEFLTKYLAVDWADLAKQKPYIMKEDDESTVHPAYDEFDQYLQKYPAEWFESLLTEQKTPMEWSELIQQVVTDYFVAYNRAPLATHAGFSQKAGDSKSGIQETRPSGHGEPAANKALSQLEQVFVNALSTCSNQEGFGKQLDKKNTTIRESLSEYIKIYGHKYWDPGTDKVNGIADEKQLGLLQEEYRKMFRRAYPIMSQYIAEDVDKIFADTKPSGTGVPLFRKEIIFDYVNTCATHADDIEEETDEVEMKDGENKESSSKMVVEEEKLPISFDSVGETEEAAEEDDQDSVEVSQDKFQARVGLKESLTSKAERLSADQIKVSELKLSDDRPPTKYHIIGQKSHTVSWTLFLTALRNSSADQKVDDFLKKMLAKWQFLSDQDWEGMMSMNQISATDLPKRKREGVTARVKKVNRANIERLQEIHSLIQPNLFNVQAAVSGLKMGELTWQTWLQKMISDYVVVYQSSPYASNKDGKPDGKGEPHANKVLRDPDNYSKDAVLKASEVHKDVNWKMTALVNQEIEEKYKTMAMIYYKWESCLQEAYPDVWTLYEADIRKISNEIKVPAKSFDKDLGVDLAIKMEKIRKTYQEVKPKADEVRDSNAYYRGLKYADTKPEQLDRSGDPAYLLALQDYEDKIEGLQKKLDKLADWEDIEDGPLWINEGEFDEDDEEMSDTGSERKEDDLEEEEDEDEETKEKLVKKTKLEAHVVE